MTFDEKLALSRAQRAKKIAWVLWSTLALNWFVASLKIIFGLVTHCMVITADGFHSLADGASNIIGLVAISVSGHPADLDHPYGHQKYETLASTVISFFLFLVSFGILKEAVLGLIHPKEPLVTATSFIVMAASLVINIFVVLYERRKGKSLQSDFLLSDSWHTLTDIFVTIAVFVALIGIYLKVPRLDALFSFAIGVIILITAGMILKRSSDILCDKAVLETAYIEKIVRAVQGVKDCHEIRTRGRADDVYVDLHVLVDPQMSVLESHRLANIIERDIRHAISGVHDVVVHIEPTTHDHNEIEN